MKKKKQQRNNMEHKVSAAAADPCPLTYDGRVAFFHESFCNSVFHTDNDRHSGGITNFGHCHLSPFTAKNQLSDFYGIQTRDCYHSPDL
jgi:hypothetical protein